VPSPKPKKIIEESVINTILNNKDVVICCGGGGIPVVEKEGQLYGVEGVIDKDYATCLLSKRINADLMVITTGVEKVAVNFKKKDEQLLDCMTINEAKNFYDHEEFPSGSMGPKILAAIDFVENTGNEVIITLPEKTLDAINGKTGTRIIE
jgi:carbamate kinase